MSTQFDSGKNVPSKKDLSFLTSSFVIKYKTAKEISLSEQLSHEQVEEILDGVRWMIYQYEELKPKNE